MRNTLHLGPQLLYDGEYLWSCVRGLEGGALPPTQDLASLFTTPLLSIQYTVAVILNAEVATMTNATRAKMPSDIVTEKYILVD
jgi:hypothetical protein